MIEEKQKKHSKNYALKKNKSNSFLLLIEKYFVENRIHVNFFVSFIVARNPLYNPGWERKHEGLSVCLENVVINSLRNILD